MQMLEGARSCVLEVVLIVPLLACCLGLALSPTSNRGRSVSPKRIPQ
jgi:hypothetical protein